MRSVFSLRLSSLAMALAATTSLLACGGAGLDSISVASNKKLGDLTEAEVTIISTAITKEYEAFRTAICKLSGAFSYTFSKAFGADDAAAKKACTETTTKCETGSPSENPDKAMKDSSCKEATVGELVACVKEQKTQLLEATKDTSGFSCDNPDSAKVAASIEKTKPGPACTTLGEKCPAYKEQK